MPKEKVFLLYGFWHIDGGPQTPVSLALGPQGVPHCYFYIAWGLAFIDSSLSLVHLAEFANITPRTTHLGPLVY